MRISTTLALLFISTIAFSQGVADRLRQAEVRKHLTELVDEEYIPGFVYGTYSDGRQQLHTYGQADIAAEKEITETTIFEIGSVTKVFTALLAQTMVQDGLLDWEAEASSYLPDDLPKLTKGDKPVTLRHLVTHTSGLPRMPGNFRPEDSQNPYTDYTKENLYEYLKTADVQTEPGKEVHYSNLGAALLGHICSLAGGKTYAQLLSERVLQPLDINSATIGSAGENELMAKGYSTRSPVANWAFNVLAPAGALTMNGEDFMKFLAAAATPQRGPLAEAMQATQQVVVEQPNGFVGLGWQGIEQADSRLFWHNGGTGGFRSFLGAYPEQSNGQLLLINDSFNPDYIMLYALGITNVLPKVRKAIPTYADDLRQYLGRYQLNPGFAIEITKKGEQLYAQATNQPTLPLYAEAEDVFFYKAVQAVVRFEFGQNGDVARLVLEQGGQKLPMLKVR